MAKQHALTLVTPVVPAKHDELAARLMKIRAGLTSGTFKEFDRIDTLHYARYVLLEDKLSSAKTNLVFSSDYDGDEDQHLMEFTSRCADLIDTLYSCCEGYPAPIDRTAATREKYLRKWDAPDSAFYIGAPGRSLKQVKQESALRDYIWSYLNKNKWDGKTAREVHGTVKKHITDHHDFTWTKEQITLPKPKWFTKPAALVAIGLILLPVTLPVAIFVGIWLLILHFRYEVKDEPINLTPSQLDPEHIRIMEEYEDLMNQNQFTQIIAMKPGWFRLATFKAVMLYGKFRVDNEFVDGELMGIPTIHFARWVLLENKQVLFLSNFDGSWQQYLGDFIDKSGWGLTAIFGNTEKFPRARYLFWGGAYDEEHFLAWSRYFQIPSQVWYCAYPHLSIKNVNTNSIIRHELMQDLSEEQAKTFLNRF